VDAAIAAIANPVRRRMLILIRGGEQSSSELAKATGLTRPAASQHLRVLRDAGLVTVRTDRRYRHYEARRERLEALRAYLEDFWVGSIAMLEDAAEQQPRPATDRP
jgi:DNA-binding transcriptional ArsR family regulator